MVAYIALGANLGDRAQALRGAVRQLHQTEGMAVRRVSPVYETRAHTLTPGEVQPPFLNAVAEVATTLSAEAVLEACLAVEMHAGRTRSQRWEPRVLDLDLLLYGQETIHTDRLAVPHPRMAARRFVLQPLADLAPDLHLPAPFDATVAELLQNTTDPDEPKRTTLRLFGKG